MGEHRRYTRAFITALAVAFVVLSWLSDSGRSTQQVVTGTVVDFQAGEWISIVNDRTDPTGLRTAVRDTTVYEGPDHESVDPAVIKPGVRVTLRYRSIAERRPVADTVSVLQSSRRMRGK